MSGGRKSTNFHNIRIFYVIFSIENNLFYPMFHVLTDQRSQKNQRIRAIRKTHNFYNCMSLGLHEHREHFNMQAIILTWFKDRKLFQRLHPINSYRALLWSLKSHLFTMNVKNYDNLCFQVGVEKKSLFDGGLYIELYW